MSRRQSKARKRNNYISGATALIEYLDREWPLWRAREGSVKYHDVRRAFIAGYMARSRRTGAKRGSVSEYPNGRALVPGPAEDWPQELHDANENVRVAAQAILDAKTESQTKAAIALLHRAHQRYAALTLDLDRKRRPAFYAEAATHP